MWHHALCYFTAFWVLVDLASSFFCLSAMFWRAIYVHTSLSNTLPPITLCSVRWLDCSRPALLGLFKFSTFKTDALSLVRIRSASLEPFPGGAGLHRFPLAHNPEAEATWAASWLNEFSNTLESSGCGASGNLAGRYLLPSWASVYSIPLSPVTLFFAISDKLCLVLVPV